MFTDYLGNPVAPGDIITYPVASGSSSADINLARVEVIDPIVADPGHPGYFCYESMRSKREHAVIGFPKRYEINPITGARERIDDPEKAYQVKIRKLREGRTEYGSRSYDNPDRTFTIRNVDRIVVVTSLTVIR